MTREDYIRNRGNVGSIIYQHYLENFNSAKHQNLLNQGDFFFLFQQWNDEKNDFQNAIEMLLMGYDIKFNVVLLKDKQGNPLRYE